MLTVDFDRLGLKAGDLILDMGAGAGRHAFEVYRRGAHIVALDYSLADLKDVSGLFAAMTEAGEAPAHEARPDRYPRRRRRPHNPRHENAAPAADEAGAGD